MSSRLVKSLKACSMAFTLVSAGAGGGMGQVLSKKGACPRCMQVLWVQLQAETAPTGVDDQKVGLLPDVHVPNTREQEASDGVLQQRRSATRYQA